MSSDNVNSDNLASSSNSLRQKIKDKFTPDIVARLQHVSYLLIGMLVCMILKGTMGKISSSGGTFSILRKGCELVSTFTNSAANAKSGPTFFSIPSFVNVSNVLASSNVALSSVCYANTLIYRISFSLALFYFIHFISVSDLTCCIDADARMILQTKFFTFKAIILCLFLFLTFFIPNTFFVYYAWICMIGGAFFLILQVLLLVDWSYYWNDEWGKRSDRNSKWQIYLLIIAIGTFGFGVIMTIINFYFFTPHEKCNLHGFLIIFTAISGISYTMIAIWVPHGSIVPSGIVFAYTTAIMFSTLKTSGNSECNRLANSSGSFKLMIVSAIFTSGLLGWSVVSSGGSRSALSLRDDEELAAEDPDETGHLAGYCYFYVIMILGSMYLAMIATDWEISGAIDSNGKSQGIWFAFWVKFGSIVLTIFLYFWSLLAPYICFKDRDFGFDSHWE